MKFFIVFVAILFVGVSNNRMNAQDSLFRITVFSPIYIDSAFNGNVYKITGNYLPKNMLPGLDFYNGVMLAVDSLRKEGVPLIIDVYDSKNCKEGLQSMINKNGFDKTMLIVASLTTKTELKTLADYAQKKQIPLISATFPNDGGLNDHSNIIILNSTIKTHCKGIYNYLKKYHIHDDICFITRKGSLEDMIKNYFSDLSKSEIASPLKYKTIELTDTFSNAELLKHIDTAQKTVFIGATTNDAFATRLINALSEEDIAASVIGMPTWDGLKNLDKPIYKNVEVIYSTPFYFSKTDKLVADITQKYRKKFIARPSDMVFKGYECLLHFSKLLLQYGNEFTLHLSETGFNVFNHFNIQPSVNTLPTPYLENKNLYFIKKLDGQFKSATLISGE